LISSPRREPIARILVEKTGDQSVVDWILSTKKDQDFSNRRERSPLVLNEEWLKVEKVTADEAAS
jgi:hypothetical protein